MDTGIALIMLGIFFLLVFSAFFSSSETGLTSISKARLHKLAADGSIPAKRVEKILKKPETLLSTILLGNNLVNIGASALSTGLMIQLFGDVGVAYATIIMTLLVLIFAEVLPKTLAHKYPEDVAFMAAWPMHWLMILFKPVTYVVRKLSRSMMRLCGINPNATPVFSEHDVRGAISLGLAQGVIEHGKHRMLDSILDLDNLVIADVMVHRSVVDSVPQHASLQEVYQFVINTRYSRIPVWQDDPDHIVGIFHVKDFYYHYHQNKPDWHWQDILQPTYFVPETTSIHQQLLEFRRHRRHMALVVDEYGDFLGLVTLEDILEEIVGEIEDEHDDTTVDIIPQPSGSAVLAGHVTVRDANRALNWQLPDDDAVTVAGLVMDTLTRIPSLGETVQVAGYKIRVVAKKRQALTKLIITPNQEETDS